MDSKYVVDTSVLLRRTKNQYYDEQSFPIHWKNFDKLVDNGIIISTDLVKREILHKYHDLDVWVYKHDFMFKEMDNNVADVLFELSNNFNEWYGNIRNKKTSADPGLIALAKAYGLILVTQETYNPDSKEKNYKIPTVCEKSGARCIVNDMRNSHIIPKDSFDFECICFSELVKREKLHDCTIL